MTLAAHTHTVADLLDPPDGKLYELIDGELVERLPSTMASWLATQISSRLGNFADQSGKGWPLVEMPIYCGSDVRRPSVSFFVVPPPREMWNDEVATIAPDVCSDIVFAETTAEALERKIASYFRIGVRLVWVVFPKSRTIHVRRPDGTAAVLTDGGTLTGGDVLPGFSIAATDALPPRAAVIDR